MDTFRLAALILCCAAFASQADAAVTNFDSRETFLASLDDYAFESFEDTPVGQLYQSDAFSLSNARAKQGAEGGKHPTHGTKFMDWGSPTTTTPAGIINLNFNEAVNSIGFFITDFGDTTQPSSYIGQLIVSLDTGFSYVAATNPPRLPNANRIFIGLTSAVSFHSLSINASTINDGLGIDEIYYSAVPEPGTVTLGMIGSLLLFARRSVKKSRLQARSEGLCIGEWES